MKKLIVLLAMGVFSLNVMAQDYPSDKMQTPDQVTVKYCGVIKDGKVVVMQENKQLTANITLANGTTIKTDGTIIKKDGSEIMLKNGECADNTGNIIIPKTNSKSNGEKMPPKN